MTKLFYCVRRKDGVTREEFGEHWQYPHAPLGTRDPRVLRYVQFHTLPYDPLATDGSPRHADEYDGVACAWWQDDAVMTEYMTDPKILEDQEDMLFFIDHDQSVGETMRELAILEPAGRAPVVAVQFLARRTGLSREQFQDAWAKDAREGELGRAIAALHERKFVQGYLQNFTLAEGESGVENLDERGRTEEAWDGFGVLYLNSVATAKALAGSDEAATALFARNNDYVDTDRSMITVMRRHSMKEDSAAIR